MTQSTVEVLARLQTGPPPRERQLWLHNHRADMLWLINAVGLEQAADFVGLYGSTVRKWLASIEPDPEGVW